MSKNNFGELFLKQRHKLRYPNEYLTSFVLRNFKAGMSILDLGCGSGRHVKLLAENGFKAYGCDCAQSGIDATRELLEATLTPPIYPGNVDLRVLSMDELSYDDNTFDGVVCQGVLMYANKEMLLKTIDEIYRVLKDGGKAHFVVKNTGDYRYKNATYADGFMYIINESDSTRPAHQENGNHWHFFQRDEIKELFKKFKSVEINRQTIYHANDSYADDNYEIIAHK